MMQRLETWYAKKRFGAAERLRIYAKLASLLEGNIAEVDCLRRLFRTASHDGRRKDRPAAMALAEWYRRREEGQLLSDAMTGWIPASERMVIAAGEESGRLAESLRSLVSIARSMKDVRQAAVGALFMPMVLLIAAGGLLYFFGTEIVPQYQMALPVERWPSSARSFAVLAVLVADWWTIVGAATASLLALVFWSFANWRGGLRVYADRLAPWSIYRVVVGAGFLSAMAALIAAKKTTTDSLRALQGPATPYLAERLRSTLRHTEEGRGNLGEALYRTGLEFPDREIVEDLRTFGALPHFEAQLRRIASEWVSDASESVKTQARSLNVALTLVVFAIVMWAGTSIYAIMLAIGRAA